MSPPADVAASERLAAALAQNSPFRRRVGIFGFSCPKLALEISEGGEAPGSLHAGAYLLLAILQYLGGKVDLFKGKGARGIPSLASRDVHIDFNGCCRIPKQTNRFLLLRTSYEVS